MDNFKSIKNWAEEDKPREKLMNKGAKSLTNAELLAILINTGTKNLSALDIARQLMELAGQDLIQLQQLNLQDIKKIKGLGPKKAITLLAAIELGRRGKLANAMEKKKVQSSKQAFEILETYFTDLDREACFILFMDTSNKVLKVESISEGGMTATILDPRIIFKKALEIKGTTQFIIAHNHPSGNLKASQADIQITKKIKEGGSLLELQLVDHLIIGHNDYYSFQDNGLMP